MEIIHGLFRSSVYRLKSIWQNVSTKRREILHQLTALMCGYQNYSDYRSKIKSINHQMKPVLPYFPIFLSDLVLIENTSANYLNKKLINFQKIYKITKILALIKDLQQRSFEIYPVMPILKFIKKNENYISLSQDFDFEF